MLGLCWARVGPILALSWAMLGLCSAMLRPSLATLADFRSLSKTWKNKTQDSIIEGPPSQSLVAIAIASGECVHTRNASAPSVRPRPKVFSGWLLLRLGCMPGNLIPSGLGSIDHSCPNNHKKPCGTIMTYSDNGVMVYVYVFQYYKYIYIIIYILQIQHMFS